MIFLVRPNCTLLYEDLVNLHDRLETELNSNVGKVVVIPADCEYDVITGESEMITKVRSMLE